MKQICNACNKRYQDHLDREELAERQADLGITPRDHLSFDQIVSKIEENKRKEAGMASGSSRDSTNALSNIYKRSDLMRFQDPANKLSNDPRAFLNKLKEEVDWDALTDPDKLKILVWLTQGTTRTWVISTLVNSLNPNTNRPYTWAEASLAFKRHFALPGQDAVYDMEWSMITHLKAEPVHNFYNRFIELMSRMEYDPNSAHVIRHFVSKLQADIQAHMNQVYYVQSMHVNRAPGKAQYDTLEDAYRAAVAAEKRFTHEAITKLHQDKITHGINYNTISDPQAKLTLDVTQIGDGSRALYKRNRGDEDANNNAKRQQQTNERAGKFNRSQRSAQHRANNIQLAPSLPRPGPVSAASRQVFAVDNSFDPQLKCDRCKKTGHLATKCTFRDMSELQMNTAKTMIRGGVPPLEAIQSVKTEPLIANHIAPPASGTKANNTRAQLQRNSSNAVPLGRPSQQPPASTSSASSSSAAAQPPRDIIRGDLKDVCTICDRRKHKAENCFFNPASPQYGQAPWMIANSKPDWNNPDDRQAYITWSRQNRRINAVSVSSDDEGDTGVFQLNRLMTFINKNERCIYIRLPKSDDYFTTLLDTGATHSCIDNKTVQRLGLSIIAPPANDNQPIKLASGTVPRIGSVKTKFIMHWLGENRPAVEFSEDVVFEVVNDMTQDFIVGMDLLQHISPNDDTVKFNRFRPTPAPVMNMVYFDLDLQGRPIDLSAKSQRTPEGTKQAALAAMAILQRKMRNHHGRTRDLISQLYSAHVESVAVALATAPPKTSATTTSTTAPSSSTSSAQPSSSVHSSPPTRRAGAVAVQTLPYDRLNPNRDPKSPFAKCTQCASSEHEVDDCPEVVAAASKYDYPSQQ
jgi:hypothetical protein